MTREEVEQRRIDNIVKKGERALATAKLFIELEGNVSDVELAKRLKEKGIETSSSTVGRDLSENLEYYYYFLNKKDKNVNYNEDHLNEEQLAVIKFIKNKRKDNKYQGTIKGGLNSSINNEYIRDENNKFKGSKPRV